MRHVLAVLLLLLPALASAQAPASPVLRPEARIRVRLGEPGAAWQTGRFVSLTPDTLSWRDGSVRAAPLSAVARLEASRGRARGRWTLAGVGVGLVGGILYSRATLDDEPADIGGVQNTAEGLANTIVAMVMGGAAGYLLAPERWTPVALPDGR